MANTHKLLLIIAILIIILLIPFYYLLKLISSLITIPGTILVVLLILIVLLNTFTRLLIFPGAFLLWRRSLESHFCKEMSAQLLSKTTDIQNCLEILLGRSGGEDFISSSAETLYYAKRLICALIDNFLTLKEDYTVTKRQSQLMQLLINLQLGLQETKIIISDKEPISVWEWMDNVSVPWQSIVFEDFPQHVCAFSALSTLSELEVLLTNSCGDTSFNQKLRRWLTDTSLGTLNQMRVELEVRYNAQQVWVQTDDKCSLDCIFLPAEAPDAPVLIICNPNAGYYEFSYYQNQWLEYFLSAGLSVFMWNYRGYGRSQGRPSIARLKKDAETVVEYISVAFSARKIGVYGENLGGCIASHIAKVKQIDFLFIDRSFSSLERVAFFNFSKRGYWLFRIFFCKAEDAVSDFIEVESYKVLSFDPLDGSIHDLASLKAGVAIRAVKEHKNFPFDVHSCFHILPEQETLKLLRSLEAVMVLVVKNLDTQNQLAVNLGPSNLSHRALLDDNGDEEVFAGLLQGIFAVLDSLDAGGKPISHVYIDKPQVYAMKVWLIVFDVYGSYLPLMLEDIGQGKIKAVNKLKNSIEEFEKMSAEHQATQSAKVKEVLVNLRVIIDCFKLILNYYERPPNEHSVGIASEESNAELNFVREFDSARVGHLLPILSVQGQTEKMLMEYHLNNSMLLV